MNDLDQNVRFVSPRHMVIDHINPDKVPFAKLDRKLYDNGRNTVIFGGGPSHVEVDTSILYNCNILAVNSSCRKVKDIVKEKDILYFSDNSWCEHYNDLVMSWPGMVMTSNRNSKAKYQDRLFRVELRPIVEWLEVKSDCVYVSSGHTATCLAAYLGAKRIILIGFECGLVNGRSHGHDDYSAHTVSVFSERYIPDWNSLAPRFQELNIEIVNSTPDSYLKCFPYLDFEKALNL